MQEIAKQFKEELHELLSRYKRSLSNTQIISIIRSVTKKELGWADNPELVERAKHILHEGSLGRDAVAGINNNICSSQEIAEADCDGDIRHCKNACGKLRMNKTTISDYQGADRKPDGDCVVREEEPLEW